MKRYFKDMIRIFAALMLLAAATATTGCSDDKEAVEPAVTEGVVFEFAKRTIYDISDMTDMASVKITLSQNGKNFELPTLMLSGTSELVATAPYGLAPGSYTFVSYIAYDVMASKLFKVEVDKNNQIEVTANKLTTFDLPIEIRVVEFPGDYYRSAIHGLCIELFGKDNEDAYPWDFTKKDLRDMQKNNKAVAYLEFEVDDFENIVGLTGLNFTGEEFASIEQISFASLLHLRTVKQITLTDLPNLKKVSGLNVFTDLEGLTLVNTGVSELPADMAQCKKMLSLALVNSQFAEVPAITTEFKDLRDLHIIGNQLTEVTIQLGELTMLSDVDLSSNPLTKIADGVFVPANKLNNVSLHDTQLTTLPAVFSQIGSLRGVNIAKSKFTALPAALTNHANLRTLVLSGNQIPSINAADFDGMTKLQGLYLSDMELSSVPKLALAELIELGIENCGLTAIPDLTALPKLRSLLIGGNDFTSFSTLDFTANPLLRILSLASSAKLTALPSDSDFKVIKESGAVKNFAHLDVNDCPLLIWTSPVSWRAFDRKLGEMKPDGSFEHLYGPNVGRVAIDRTGSQHVTLGK